MHKINSSVEYFRRILNRIPWWDGIVTLSMIVAGLKFVSGYEDYHSITLYDEAMYLERGVNIPVAGLPSAHWAPLYSLWYYVLSFFTSNNIELFYLQVKLSYILPAIILYLALRTFKVSPIPSIALAVYFLISWANITPWPRITSFAIVLLLALLVVSSFCRRLTAFILVSAIGSLLISFVRPEFFASCLLLTGAYFLIVYLKRNDIDKMAEAKGFIAFFAVLTTLLLVFGSPIGARDNYRTRWAFQQHFSLNWVEWTQDKTLNPWTECDKISKNSFGEIDSIQQAALNNPSIFIKHIVTNILNYPSTLVYSLAHTSIDKAGPRYSLIEMILFILLLVIYAFSLIWHKQRARMETKVKRAIALLAVFLLPSVISTFVIYPRPHYVTLHIVVAIILLSLLLFRIQSTPWKNKLSTALLTGVLVVVITPSPYIDTTEKPIKKSPHRVQKAIKFIQDLGIKKKVNLLGAHGGFNVYIGSNYSRVDRDEKKAPFFQFLKKNQINMIFLFRSLVTDSRFSSDPEWKMFITDPKKYGFNVINAKEIIGGYLLVHTSLTSAHP